MARELLSNVVRHAGARSVQLVLGRSGTSARLVVTDNGRGIDSAALGESASRGHIGLHSHRLRVEAAGGTFTIGPAASAGTTATVELPVPVPADRSDRLQAAAR